MTCDKRLEDNPLEKLEALVDSIYFFKDHFFESHTLEEAGSKSSLLKTEESSALVTFKETETEAVAHDRARYLYLKGRLLNVSGDFSAEAEGLLSKAVKLNPSLVEAWNELGESYMRKFDWATAKTCFEGALGHTNNKVSLRCLSMTLRQVAAPSTEAKLSNVESGLSKAKEAVALDTGDGLSWSLLGNAYLSHFFLVSQNPTTLKQAMTAYSQAEKDVVARSTPELHYNKGIALKYEEDFSSALNSFLKAGQLDPTWSSPRDQESQLSKYLADIVTLIQLKGKLKAKKISQLLDSLPESHLGPYGGGNSSSKGATVKLSRVDFDSLHPGCNSEVVVLGKVICSVHNTDSVPFTFCLMDRQGHCLAVSLYNLSPGKGVIIGDSVAIAEPVLANIDFSHRDRGVKFQMIRVESPLVLVINGKKASRDFQAGVQMSSFTKND